MAVRSLIFREKFYEDSPRTLALKGVDLRLLPNTPCRCGKVDNVISILISDYAERNAELPAPLILARSGDGYVCLYPQCLCEELVRLRGTDLEDRIVIKALVVVGTYDLGRREDVDKLRALASQICGLSTGSGEGLMIFLSEYLRARARDPSVRDSIAGWLRDPKLRPEVVVKELSALMNMSRRNVTRVLDAFALSTYAEALRRELEESMSVGINRGQGVGDGTHSNGVLVGNSRVRDEGWVCPDSTKASFIMTILERADLLGDDRVAYAKALCDNLSRDAVEAVLRRLREGELGIGDLRNALSRLVSGDVDDALEILLKPRGGVGVDDEEPVMSIVMPCREDCGALRKLKDLLGRLRNGGVYINASKLIGSLADFLEALSRYVVDDHVDGDDVAKLIGGLGRRLRPVAEVAKAFVDGDPHDLCVAVNDLIMEYANNLEDRELGRYVARTLKLDCDSVRTSP